MPFRVHVSVMQQPAWDCGAETLVRFACEVGHIRIDVSLGFVLPACGVYRKTKADLGVECLGHDPGDLFPAYLQAQLHLNRLTSQQRHEVVTPHGRQDVVAIIV